MIYHVDLEYTLIKRDNETRSYFIMLNGSPLLGSPIRQMVTVSEKGLETLNIPSLTGMQRDTRKTQYDDTSMTERLEVFRQKYRDEFLAFAADRLPTGDSNAVGRYIQDLKQAEIRARVSARLAAEQGTAEAQVLLLATVEQSIQTGEALDLAVTPRANRYGDGTIAMCGRK